METTFSFTQAQLAPLLGISIEEIRRRKKKLAEGTDWKRDGNRVLFSDDGLKNLRAALSVPEPVLQKTAPEETPPANGAPPESEPLQTSVAAPQKPRRVFCLPARPLTLAEARELVVWQACPNQRIVLAHLPGLKEVRHTDLARVQVRDNTNFTRGMVMPVKLLQAPDFFEFTGRAPRWRGKY